MAQLFANNVASVTVGSITANATTLKVAQGNSFPSPAGGDYFLATLVGLDNNGNENAWEIVKVTARSSNTLTIVRAQENTIAKTWPDSTRIEIRLTAGILSEIMAELEQLMLNVVDKYPSQAGQAGKVLHTDGDNAFWRYCGQTGLIGYFAAVSPPSGWLKANGAAVSRTTYAGLFAVIGTLYGAGDGSATFNLPDLRGEFLRGFDDGRGLDAGRVFGSVQAGQNASHTHTASAAAVGDHAHTAWMDSQGDHSHSSGTIAADNSLKVSGVNGGTSASGSVRLTGAAGSHTHNIGTAAAGSHTHTVTVAASGGNETRPRNIALLACIKY